MIEVYLNTKRASTPKFGGEGRGRSMKSAKIGKASPRYGVEINNTTQSSIDENFLRRISRHVLKGEQVESYGLSIALVNPNNMRELNRQYGGKDKVANVLSFPFDKTQGKPNSELGLGEVVLCPQEVRKDAKKYGMLFTDTLVWMLVHGILHLLRYNHEKDRDEEKMIQKEQYYLNKVKSSNK